LSATQLDNHASLFGQHPDSVLDSRLIAKTLAKGEHLSRWIGWRLRLLVVAALIGCLSLALLVRWLGDWPDLPGQWRANSAGQLELESTHNETLKPMVGRALLSINGPEFNVYELDASVLMRSARWLTDNATRHQLNIVHTQIAKALSQKQVTLTFAHATPVQIEAAARSPWRLGVVFWVLSLLALGLYVVAMVTLLARPSLHVLLFSVMALCQSGNLLFMAIESSALFGFTRFFYELDWSARLSLDAITCACVVHMVTLHPRHIPHKQWVALAGWVAMGGFIMMLLRDQTPHLWWGAQTSMALMGTAAIGVLTWSYKLYQHPYAIVIRRFTLVVVGTWVLLTIAVAIADADKIAATQQQIKSTGQIIWYVFLGLLLVLSSFLSKSQQVMREFSLLAVTSTLATSLDLLFVAIFSLGQFTSVTLALFLSLGLYAGARQWLLSRFRSDHMITTERMFEKLYKIARKVETHPERTPALFSELLCELFNPIETLVVKKKSKEVRVVGDGSTLLVPVPCLTSAQSDEPSSIVLRYANKGQRLFNSEDARLSGRIGDQLCRAVAFDKAVEQGRSEERLRLAQDLHDDIGARLLTLMYKAQAPEIEEYLRYTLQDLKTLTRGLAAATRLLSDAAGEWKADLTQRLQAAQVTLTWNLSFDHDTSLSVVQWSGLTRIMRELVSNVIAHAQARKVAIEFHLKNDQLQLSVSDNGNGCQPQTWSHGLGLGGIRKRVKQLGGEVLWRENMPRGIYCTVTIAPFSQPN
jgi:signal transduction histidine kinase